MESSGLILLLCGTAISQSLFPLLYKSDQEIANLNVMVESHLPKAYLTVVSKE